MADRLSVRPPSARPPEVGQRCIELGGVLPHVEPDGAEPEGLDLTPNRAHQSGCERRAAARVEGFLDQPEIGDQGLGRGIPGRVERGLAPLGRGDHDIEPPPHAGEILAEDLPRIAGRDLVPFSGRRQLAIECFAEVLGAPAWRAR